MKPHDPSHRPLVDTAAWLGLGTRSASAIGDLLGAPIIASTISPTAAAEQVTCVAVTLVDPARGCEVNTVLLASSVSALEIGRRMLGGECTGEDARDALAEVLNVVGGVVKAAFVAEGFSFTLGLPGCMAVADFDARRSASVASATVNLSLGEHGFALSYLVTQAAAMEVLAEDLHEGYVLAQDLRIHADLVIPSCTRLTEGAAREIRETCRGMRVLACGPMRA